MTTQKINEICTRILNEDIKSTEDIINIFCHYISCFDCPFSHHNNEYKKACVMLSTTQLHNIAKQITDKDKPTDQVNSPAHYNQGKIEVIEVIEDWQLNFHLGNAIKYIARCGHKENKEQDLKKAIWYIERELKNE